MRVRIWTDPEARDQARDIARWWRANRPAAPLLFQEELIRALRLLAEAPEIGRSYDHPEIPGLRRIVLPESRHHVYYVYEARQAADRRTCRLERCPGTRTAASPAH